MNPTQKQSFGKDHLPACTKDGHLNAVLNEPGLVSSHVIVHL